MMGLAVYLVQYYLSQQQIHMTKRTAALIVAIAVPLGAGVFIAAAGILRCSELRELLSTVRRRAEETDETHDAEV
jgi:hypothetical protein